MSKPRGLGYYGYLYGLTLLGSVVILVSLARIAQAHIPLGWVIVASLTILTGSFTIRIPGLNSKISVAETFIFVNTVLFGVAPGVLTAVLDALSGSMRSPNAGRRVEYALFNVGATAFSAGLAGGMFFLAMGQGPLFEGPSFGLRRLLISVVLMALVHFLANSASVAGMIALDSGRGIYRIWRESFLWTSATSLAGASVAGLVALNVQAITPAVIGIIAPTIVIIHFTHKTYLQKAEEKVKHLGELNALHLSTVEALAMAIDARDQLTHGHVRRVQVYARELARALGITDDNTLRGIEAAALLHDIGKLAIPEYILNKPGKLTRVEFQKVMEHPGIGAGILESISFPYPVADCVRHHHESWNGSGYPDGLKGNRIPLGARILSVVDCFEALTCDRPYRRAYSTEKALALIRARAGKRYDPDIVAKFEAIAGQAQEAVREAESHEPAVEERKPLFGTDSDRGPVKMRRSQDSRAFHGISSTHREVSAMFDLAQTVGSTLNLQGTLLIIANKIGKIIPFTTGVVYLLDPEEDCLHAAHVSGANVEAFRGCVMDLGKSLSGSVVAQNEPAINADPAPDLEPVVQKITVALDNALVYPLNFEGRRLGVLSLYASQGARFTDDHVRVMEIVSKQAATAISNALKFEETQEDAFKDLLTGLPNSRWLYPYLEREIEKSVRSQHPLVVLLMDLDGFKEINDRFGHAVGDRMLIEVAKILRTSFRASDAVARYAGDEFVAVMSQISAKDAALMAMRMQEILDDFQLEVWPGKYATTGISIGFAICPAEGDSMEVLLAKADQAMYRNKEMRAKSPRPRFQTIEAAIE